MIQDLLEALSCSSINDLGHIVGFYRPDGTQFPSGFHRAFIYTDADGVKDLGIPGQISFAHAINNLGEIVGSYFPIYGAPLQRYLRSVDGTLYDLGALNPLAISDSGWVVGGSVVGGGASHAFLYRDGQWIDLDHRQGLNSSAEGINSSGHIVGYFIDGRGDQRAFLHSGRGMEDLNDLIPRDSGWILRAARAVNDTGQIVGAGDYQGRGCAFLLTPIDSASCTFSLSQASQTFNANSASGTVRVSAPAHCTWSAVSNADWISVDAFDGTGSGHVRYSVSATTSPRAATMAIAGQTFTVTQIPTYYYGIGDSVASGHGLPDDAGEPCRQSSNAYPRIVGRALALDGVIDRGPRVLENGVVRYLGCSGTSTGVQFPDHTNRFLSVQVDAVISDLRAVRAQGSAMCPALVSITVGANDFPWADVFPGGDGPRFICQARPGFEAEVQGTAALVHELLSREVAKLVAEGDVSVVLTTYHNPFNRRSIFFSVPIFYRSDRGCLLIPEDAELYDRTEYVVGELNRVIRRVVTETGDRAALADVYGRFSHHESPRGPSGLVSCGEAPPQFGNSWIQAPLARSVFDVELYRKNDCFHPNERGAVEYARKIVESARRRLLP